MHVAVDDRPGPDLLARSRPEIAAGHAPAPRGTPWRDVRPVEFAGRRDADQGHRLVDFVTQDAQHVLDALLAVHGQTVDVGASDQDRPGSERERLDDIAAAPNPAVHQHLGPVTDGVDDGRQRLEPARRRPELAAAVVRHDHAFGAELDRAHRVLRPHDALDVHRALPVVADPGQIVPVQATLHELAILDRRRFDRSGDAALGYIVRSADALVHDDVVGPTRVADRVEQSPRGHHRRNAHTVAALTLAIASGRHINRHDQHRHAGGLGPFHQLLGHSAGPGVELKERVDGRRRGHVLDRPGRRGTQYVASALVGGRASRTQVAVPAGQAGEAGRTEQDGQFERHPGDLGRQVTFGGSDQLVRYQRPLVECGPIVVQRDQIIGPAVDVMPDHVGQPPPGRTVVVLDREIALRGAQAQIESEGRRRHQFPPCWAKRCQYSDAVRDIAPSIGRPSGSSKLLSSS